LSGIHDVGDAALLQQFHEFKPLEAEFTRSLASRNLKVSKKHQDGFLAEAFLQADLINGFFGDVDLDLQLHGCSIVPLRPY
jgi:hypothetical protein